MVVDKLLAAHFGLGAEEFNYKFKCIFPESASQAQERIGKKVEWIARLVETGILARESALEELKDCNILSESTTVGDDPNPPPPATTGNTK